jgi:hypothetical protein
VAVPQAVVGKVQDALVPLQVPAQAASSVAVQAVWPLCGAEPALRVVQVPGFAAMSHASHVPVQALSQQTPSGEQVVPLAQSVAVDWQLWPFFFLQTPEASQVPVHTLFGSSWFLAATQV